MKTRPRPSTQAGFTLIELLLSVAVMGVMAALIVVGISGYIRESDAAKNARNAQTVVSTFSSARSAGATFASSTLDGVINELVSGKIPSEGPLQGHRFSVSTIQPDDLLDAKEFIRFYPPTGPGADDVMMIYDSRPN